MSLFLPVNMLVPQINFMYNVEDSRLELPTFGRQIYSTSGSGITLNCMRSERGSQ